MVFHEASFGKGDGGGGQDLCQEEIGPMAWNDELGVLTDKSHPGLVRETPLQDGGRIHANPGAVSGELLIQGLSQHFRFFPQTIMIIRLFGFAVSGGRDAFGRAGFPEGIGIGEGDDRSAVSKEPRRVFPDVQVFRHPPHPAVFPIGNPGAEPVKKEGPSGTGKAYGNKAQITGQLDKIHAS